MKVRREAAQTGVDTRRATERNAVDMPGSDAAVEASYIMRGKGGIIYSRRIGALLFDGSESFSGWRSRQISLR
jgi:hypothetical protein